jgi:glutathione S-transferase
MAEVQSATQSAQAEPGGAEDPTLYVCHGDEKGPAFHPCARVQKALLEAGIPYQKIIGGHGNPIPFLRKGSREELRQATGDTKLPALKLPDGRVMTHTKEILNWIKERAPQGA